MRSGPILMPDNSLTPTTRFTFDIPDLPVGTRLEFKPLPSRSQQAYKRRRSVCDVDGEGCSQLQKKKQRLRLNLITSRLSRPYANPSTFIGSRGTCRAARWARLRRSVVAIAKFSLRKAALVNWTRLRKKAMSDEVNRQRGPPPSVEVGTLAIRDGDDGVMRGSSPPPRDTQALPLSPPRHAHVYAPPRPSPLGVSNYQALDEEDPFDDIDEDWDSVADDDSDDIYTNFTVREPEDEPNAVKETPSLDPTSQLFDVPASYDSNGPVWSMLASENKHSEISFANFRSVLPT